MLNDSHSHDAKDSSSVGVFRVRELIVTPTIIIGCLNLTVDLTAIRAFEIKKVVAMGLDSTSNHRVGDLLFRYLFDVKRKFCSWRGSVAAIASLVSAAR